jgi:hypothetical protein
VAPMSRLLSALCNILRDASVRRLPGASGGGKKAEPFPACPDDVHNNEHQLDDDLVWDQVLPLRCGCSLMGERVSLSR